MRFKTRTLAVKVNTLLFSSDGAQEDGWLVGGDAEGHLLLWDQQGDVQPEIKGHNGPVFALAFNPDGRSLYSAGGDGVIKTWKATLDSYQIAVDFDRHDGPVYALSVGNNGRSLASAGADGTMRLWRAHWTVWLEVACRRLAHHTVFEGDGSLDVPEPEGSERRGAYALCRDQVWEAAER